MKLDFKKSFDTYQARRGEFRTLDVPALRYLAVDGHGDPNTATEYADAISAIYPVSYKLKFASKTELGRDYVVPPLEALWWSGDMDAFTVARDKSQWDWTVMIMIPEWIPDDMVDEAVTATARSKRGASVDKVHVLSLAEGRCIQTLHVGSYDDEADVLAHLHHEVIPSAGLQMTGKHHEIYLNDARRGDPQRLRTILRQPVRPSSPDGRSSPRL